MKTKYLNSTIIWVLTNAILIIILVNLLLHNNSNFYSQCGDAITIDQALLQPHSESALHSIDDK